MPAAAATTTSFAGILKELYTLPPVRVLNDKSFMHDKLAKEQAVMDISGKYVTWPVTVNRSLGRGSRGDSGVLPGAISEEIVTAQIPAKYHYHTLEWSEVLEVASKNKEGAFENVVTMKMKNIAIDMAKEANRQIFNDRFGNLGVVATGANSATQTLTSTQHIRVGDAIEVFSSDGATERTTNPVYVATVDKSTKQITLVTTLGGGVAATVNTTTGDILVIAGNLVAGSASNEVEGLRHICDDDRTLHGINGSTYDEWNGNVRDAEDAVAGESLFEQLYDDIGERGRGDMDTYVTTRGIRRRLADEFASQRRYINEKATDIKAGYQMIEVNGKQCVIDDDAPKGFVFGLTLETLKVLQACKPGFLETEAGGGARIELKDHTVAGQKVAVFNAFYRYHWTLGCTDPGRNGMLINCADD